MKEWIYLRTFWWLNCLWKSLLKVLDFIQKVFFKLNFSSSQKIIIFNKNFFLHRKLFNRHWFVLEFCSFLPQSLIFLISFHSHNLHLYFMIFTEMIFIDNRYSTRNFTLFFPENKIFPSRFSLVDKIFVLCCTIKIELRKSLEKIGVRNWRFCIKINKLFM